MSSIATPTVRLTSMTDRLQPVSATGDTMTPFQTYQTMNHKPNKDSDERLSDVETELRTMAERCRQPAPQATIVLELAADIVARNGRDAAEVIRLRNIICNAERHMRHSLNCNARAGQGLACNCGQHEAWLAMMQVVYSANAKNAADPAAQPRENNEQP